MAKFRIPNLKQVMGLNRSSNSSAPVLSTRHTDTRTHTHRRRTTRARAMGLMSIVGKVVKFAEDHAVRRASRTFLLERRRSIRSIARARPRSRLAREI